MNADEKKPPRMACVVRDNPHGTLVRCPVCDLLTLDAKQGSTTVAIVGAAYLGWSLGSEGFKRALCELHRREYASLLVKAGDALDEAAREDSP